MRLLGVLLLLLAAPPEIRVAKEGWGDADPGDIRKVLESAGAVFWERLPERVVPPIEVSRSNDTPITLFKRGPKGELRIKLNVEGRQWAQFAYQFAHEIGHVACNYTDDVNPNQWFEETLCEVASLFVLGRMAETWAKNPPYPNWKGYAAALKKYREERIAKTPALTPGWFREQEPALRKNPGLRDLNTVLAVALLPLFEQEPAHWEAVGGLNAVPGAAGRSLEEHLQNWSRASAEKHRPFIRKLAAVFDITLGQ